MKRLSVTFSLLLCLSSIAAACIGAELTATGSGRAGTSGFEVTFRAVNAPDLAGIKLVLHYDAARMQYKSLTKSRETQAMMHVVNDKTPGTLIIVMASASGRKNADFVLFVLKFDLLAPSNQPSPVEIKVTGVEMMSAALVEIPCPTRTFRLQ